MRAAVTQHLSLPESALCFLTVGQSELNQPPQIHQPERTNTENQSKHPEMTQDFDLYAHRSSLLTVSTYFLRAAAVFSNCGCVIFKLKYRFSEAQTHQSIKCELWSLLKSTFSFGPFEKCFLMINVYVRNIACFQPVSVFHVRGNAEQGQSIQNSIGADFKTRKI